MQNELIVRIPVQLTPVDRIYMWHRQGDVFQQHGEEVPVVVASYGNTNEGRTLAGECINDMEQWSGVVQGLSEAAAGLEGVK